MIKILYILITGLLLLAMAGCTVNPIYVTGESASASRPSVGTETTVTGEYFYVTASWYGGKFHGRATSSGEIFDKNAMTCAHKEYAFGTKLLLENEDNGKTITVTVNDRGPFIAGRDVDLSEGAARKLDMKNDGVKKLKAKIVE